MASYSEVQNVAKVGPLGNQAPHWGRWRTQVYYTAGPQELTLLALSPKQRNYRVFINSA